jgi:hypothetical protein
MEEKNRFRCIVEVDPCFISPKGRLKERVSAIVKSEGMRKALRLPDRILEMACDPEAFKGYSYEQQEELHNEGGDSFDPRCKQHEILKKALQLASLASCKVWLFPRQFNRMDEEWIEFGATFRRNGRVIYGIGATFAPSGRLVVTGYGSFSGTEDSQSEIHRKSEAMSAWEKEQENCQLLDHSIDDLHLWWDARNALWFKHVETIGDLIQHTERELRDLDRLGRESFLNSLADVKKRLSANGLSLKPER